MDPARDEDPQPVNLDLFTVDVAQFDQSAFRSEQNYKLVKKSKRSPTPTFRMKLDDDDYNFIVCHFFK